MNIAAALLAVCIQEDAGQNEVSKVSIAVLRLNVSTDKTKFVIKTGDKETPIEASKECTAITDQFITALVRTSKFNVVERDKLEAAFKELQLSETGLTEASEIKAAGKLISAQYFFQASVSLLSASVSDKPVPDTENFMTRATEARVVMDIRIIDAESGKVVLAESCNEKAMKTKVLSKDSKEASDADVAAMLSELQRTSVNRLVSSVMDGTYPVKIVSFKDGVVWVNRGEDGLKKDEVFRVILQGDELRDPDTNAILGYEETEIARIQIIETQAKMSKAKVISWKTDDKVLEKGWICRRVKKEEKKDPKPGNKPKLGD